MNVNSNIQKPLGRNSIEDRNNGRINAYMEKWIKRKFDEVNYYLI